MGFIYIITTHKYFIFILLLFQIYLSLQSKLNQILLYDNMNNGERGPPDDIFKRYEELSKLEIGTIISGGILVEPNEAYPVPPIEKDEYILE